MRNLILSILKGLNGAVGTISLILLAFVNADNTYWLQCMLVLGITFVICMFNIYLLEHIYFIVGYVLGRRILSKLKKYRIEGYKREIHTLSVLLAVTNYNCHKAACIIAYRYNYYKLSEED